MDFNTQLSGLNELLAVIYGNGTQLDTLLRELGFEKAQVDQLRDRQLEVVVDQFLEMIHKRLTSESGKDTYYQILSRRYGLDGESPDSLEAISEKRNDSPAYLRQLFQEIIKRCQGKTAQADFKKGLQQIAVAQLGKMERPTRAHVAEKLERLSNLRGAADVTRLDYEAKRAEILKQVQAELDALEAGGDGFGEGLGQRGFARAREILQQYMAAGGEGGEQMPGGHRLAAHDPGDVVRDFPVGFAGGREFILCHDSNGAIRAAGMPI